MTKKTVIHNASMRVDGSDVNPGSVISVQRMLADNYWNDMVARNEDAGEYADGMVDAFESVDGMDTDNSTNFLSSAYVLFDPYKKLLIEGDATPFTDSSGESHTITNSNVTRNTAFKKFGDGALEFDSSAYLEVAASTDWALGSSLTIEMWIRSDNMVGLQKFISTRGSDDTGYEIMIDTSGHIAIEMFPGGTKTGTGTLTADTWYHLAITYDGSNIKIYIDGTLDSTHAASFAWGTTNALRIGRPEAYDEPFYGQIDRLTIYKGAVKYTENFDPNEDPFPGYVSPTETGETPDNMTAISVGVTSPFTPTRGNIDMMVETAGSADTDWFVDVLESTGNWENAPLTLVQDFGSNIKRYSASVDLAAADANRAYRIRTANNIDFKCTKILHTWEA